MATGAVSQLSGLAGLKALRVPLLIVAIAIAAVVTARGVIRATRGQRLTPALTPLFGLFTVPVGLAVIAAGLAATHGIGLHLAAVIFAGLAGVTTLLVTASVARAVAIHRPALVAVNGVWFIAPAAFLAVAVASSALGAPPPAVVAWVGLVAVVTGTVGYGALLTTAAARLRRHGLSGAPAVAWWIVTGCGGLAALALGRVAATGPALSPVLTVVGLVCGGIATIVLVPVAVGSVRHLSRALAGGTARRLGRAPWPPAFSSGVYALGCAEMGSAFGWPQAVWIGRVVAVETLVVWAAIAAIHVLVWLRGPRSGS